MNREAKFWDRIADRYARKPVADEEAYQEKLRVTRRYLQPDMEVLEFGCGTGSTAIVHAPYVKHIHATDISPNMIEIAKRKAAAEGTSNITFDVASVEDLEVTEGSLDAVLGLSILHLLEDKAAAIADVFDMLKPGGVFVTTTPCIADSMRWFRYLVPVGRLLGLFPLVKVFGSDDLRRSLVEAGFELDYEWQPDDGRTQIGRASCRERV